MNRSAHSWDMFVIGGGPAGLATAILAAQRGMSVAVADHQRYPIDKACGEGLMPGTVAALKTLGIEMSQGEAVPFRGIRFMGAGGENCVHAYFDSGFGIGLRRTVLHAKLVARATELGVALFWGSEVTLGGDGEVCCEGEPVGAKWVIGADGESSRFRKWAVLNKVRYERIRFALRQHFRIVPWTDFVEAYWARDCQIVVAAVARDELCVAVTSRNPRLRFSEALEQVPGLGSRLRNAVALSKLRGARSPSRRLRRVVSGRFALVGDASGSVDPLTGEGIGLGLKQAAALVEAITRNDLPSYQAAHDRIGRTALLMSRVMLALDSHPRWRQRAFGIIAAEPSLFSRLLHFNVGEVPLSNVGLGHALRFGWRMLASGLEP